MKFMESMEIDEIHEIHETHGNQYSGHHLVLPKYRAETLFPESRGRGVGTDTLCHL